MSKANREYAKTQIEFLDKLTARMDYDEIERDRGDDRGEIIAAISAGGNMNIISHKKIEYIADYVKKVALEVSKSIGYMNEKEKWMLKKQVLVIDDEQGIRDIIKEYLLSEGFEVLQSGDGMAGLDAFKTHNPALVILDVMMPKMDGWKVCREIRKFSNVPIIMLTARGEEYDKLFGFELGVDDYMVKPFSPKELIARTKAVLGRGDAKSGAVQDVMEIHDLKINFDARNVYLESELISLTPKEYDLLSFFAKNKDKVFSREQLLNQVWGYDFAGDARTVDTHVKMLRESLRHRRKWIVTSWGIGYKFEVGE